MPSFDTLSAFEHASWGMPVASESLDTATAHASSASIVNIPELRLRRGQLNVGEAVTKNLEFAQLPQAYYTNARKQLTNAFNRLARLEIDGCLLLIPSPAKISTNSLLQTLGRKRPRDYLSLWHPSSEPQSYTPEDLNGHREKSVARLMPYSATEETEIDPMLHFLGLPYDDRYNQLHPEADALPTQLAAVAGNRMVFAEQHSGYDMEIACVRSHIVRARLGYAASMTLDGWHFGSANLPSEMRRRTIGNNSVVGCIELDRESIMLDRTIGLGHPRAGLSLLIGVKT